MVRREEPTEALDGRVLRRLALVAVPVRLDRLVPRDLPRLVLRAVECPAVDDAVDVLGTRVAKIGDELLGARAHRERAGPTIAAFAERLDAALPPRHHRLKLAARFDVAAGRRPCSGAELAHVLGHPDERVVEIDDAFGGALERLAGACAGDDLTTHRLGGARVVPMVARGEGEAVARQLPPDPLYRRLTRVG